MKQSPNAYKLINSIPEYQNFSYHFDYVSIIVLITMICFIPSLISTSKTVLYYHKNSAQNSPNTIHPYVFKSFVYMQVSSIVYTVFDFIINRIPLTSVFTSYFSTMTSESPVKHIVAGYYLFEYLSQLFTVLFCLIRLLVFIDSKNYLKASSLIFRIFSVLSIIICIIVCVPHNLYGVVAIQLDIPFQYGAIVFTSTFSFTNRIQSIGRFIFSGFVTTSIVLLTLTMLWNLKSLKKLTTISNQSMKAETTLTITMFLILIPSVLNLIIILASFFATSYASYIILIRLILMDCRVNIVSWYFYWTHPYFKKNTVSKTVNAWSLTNC